MATKKKKKSKGRDEAKYIQQIRGVRDALLGGKVLAVDPSSGSSGSMPGWCTFDASTPTDSGTIEVVRDPAYFNRQLHSLNTCLRSQFDVPDVLVIEHIAPIFSGGAARQFSNTHRLHQGIGAIMAAFHCPMVSIPPSIWKKYAPENYEKTDENDAIMLGIAAINTARKLEDLEPLTLPDWLIAKLEGKDDE